MIGLTGVNVVSGTTAEGKPFCTVEATMANGTSASGQLSPEEVRMMALHFLSAAEAAESDAVTILVAKELDINDDRITGLLLMQRAKRDEAQRLARGDSHG